MAKQVKTVKARQGDRSRFSLNVLLISLPLAFAVLLALYFVYF